MQTVTKTYGKGSGSVTALHGLDISFAPGTFTAVMGPSGSGKSTLLQCAAGLEDVTSGQVLIGDTRLAALSEKRRSQFRRDTIGFIFQDYNLLPDLTVSENIALPLQLANRRLSKSDMIHTLQQVGIAEQAKKYPSQLSGGQRQRVAIARTLATRPAVVFADEPTGALDRKAGKSVLSLLQQLADNYGQTIIMVTHDPLAASYASRVVFLVDGRIAHEMERPSLSKITGQLADMES